MRKFFYKGSWHFTLEIYKFPHLNLSFTINHNEDGAIALDIGIIYQFHLSIANEKYRKKIYRLADFLSPKKWGSGGIETGIQLSTSNFEIKFFDYDMNETNRTYRFWFERITQFIFGKKIHECELDVKGYGIISIDNNEKYEAKFKIFNRSSKRPRAWWSKKWKTIEIKPEKPVVVPGKGENSWDMDDDAIYESSQKFDVNKSVQYYLDSFAESIKRRRLRY